MSRKTGAFKIVLVLVLGLLAVKKSATKRRRTTTRTIERLRRVIS